MSRFKSDFSMPDVMIINQNDRILSISAHPDDSELGAGGFLARLVNNYQAQIHFAILTDGDQTKSGNKQHELRYQESISSVSLLLNESESLVKKQHISFGKFMYTSLWKHPNKCIKFIANCIDSFEPDIILVNDENDFHSDHKMTYQYTMYAARHFIGTIILYQTPTTQLASFHPNCFVILSKDEIKTKENLIKIHNSQNGKKYIDYMRNIGNSLGLMHQITNSYIEAFVLHQTFIKK